MATKKTTNQNIDPGRPVNRPLVKPVDKDPNWGRMLTKKELIGLLDRIYKKQEEEKMSKLSDTIAKALAKKQGKTHVDGSDANPTVEKKVKVKPAIPAGKKPPTRSAGRGR